MSALDLLLRGRHPDDVLKAQRRYPRGHPQGGQFMPAGTKVPTSKPRRRVTRAASGGPVARAGRLTDLRPGKPSGDWFSNAAKWAEHTYAGSFNGGWVTSIIATRVRSGHRLGDHVEVRGRIVRFGKDVGGFTRRVYKDGTVEHALFEIDSSHQGSGFAKQFLHRSEDAYIDAGLKRITLDANISVGGYAWSRYGFTYASPKEALDRARMLERTRREMGMPRPATRGITSTTIQPWDIPRYDGVDDDIRAVVAKGARMTPQDVAEIGFKHATENEWGEKMWTGKAIMLHQSQDGWKGVKPVQRREDRSY